MEDSRVLLLLLLLLLRWRLLLPQLRRWLPLLRRWLLRPKLRLLCRWQSLLLRIP